MALPGMAAADVQNIVLVHGGNVYGSTWREVYERLIAQDFNVTISQLPMTSVEDDIAAVQRNLDVQGGPVLLVSHSYGGVIISEAGGDPDVKGLVYVASFQPDIGESANMLLTSEPTEFTADKLKIFDDGHFLLGEDAFGALNGNGLSDKDARFVARSQPMTNSANLAHEVDAAAWSGKPSWAVIATEDRVIATGLQRRMAKRAGSTVVEIENGHMLPMTSPDEVAEVIAQAARTVE
ncbi:alpha/beta hydrolase [Falsirhodobacter sp. 20TX0035]|uniref:alpha/beta hydrolase n=1 Tax=Falsirhodobacter sp. 20TX0035 TaxID=3022019 RepID=UPI00232DB0B1|nr:alpha/beta hydrolase [Falsirhodobacter sp. 20TX0035]MDB6453268.1 alpha/beta hydrolase [Falsirhodobacter sp. 20TX0035]